MSSGTVLNRPRPLDSLLFTICALLFDIAGVMSGACRFPGCSGDRTAVCMKGQDHSSTLQNTGQKQNTIEQRNIFWAPVGKAIIQTSDGDKQNKKTKELKTKEQRRSKRHQDTLLQTVGKVKKRKSKQ